MSKRLKNLIVKELKDDFYGVEDCVFVQYQGTDSVEMDEFRAKLRSKGMKFQVVKNSLAKIVFKEKGISDNVDEFLEGPTAVLYDSESILEMAHELYQNKENKDKVAVKGGISDSCVVDEQQLKEWSVIPNKGQLYAKTLSVFQGPVANFVGVLNNAAGALVRVLSALKSSKEG